MTGKTKQQLLILIGMITLLVILMAVSLSQLELQPGQPLPDLNKGQLVVPTQEDKPLLALSVNLFFIEFIALVLVIALIYILIRYLRGADWKVIRTILKQIFFIIFGLSIMLLLAIMLLPRSTETVVTEMMLPTPTAAVRTPLGETPNLLIWLAGFGFVVSLLILGVWIYRYANRPPSQISLLALEAEKARQAILNGQNLKNVIFACYRQMSLAMQQEQGLERESYMTPHEFETLLQRAGVPFEPVHLLTTLFEAARYGHWLPNAEDEQKAIRAFEAIVDYSRMNKKVSD
ncbi:MAG: DUF4129 domain-containing protein [Anaerolineae bacterium]|nr:DUF4129 domain-containing protein [Anaerolineae bacterium]